MTNFNRNILFFIMITILFIAGSCSKDRQGPGIEWEKTYGGTDADWFLSVSEASDGGYIMAGYTNSYGAGSWDMYIIKTDENGNEQWSKTYGGVDNDQARSMIQTEDGGYIIIGHTCSFGAGGADIYLIKTNSNGDSLWTRTYGGSGDEFACSITKTVDNGYLIAGQTNSFGSGGDDIWVIKINNNCDTVWTKTFGGTDKEFCRSIQQTSDGGYIIGGVTRSFGAGSDDIYVIKIDENGNKLWDRTYGEWWQEWGSVQQTSDGGYMIIGFSNSFGGDENVNDIYLIRIDDGGDTAWTKVYDNYAWDNPMKFLQTPDDYFIAVGFAGRFNDPNNDVYLMKFDKLGNLVWDRTFGGSGWEWGMAVMSTSDGGYIIAGCTDSFGAGSGDCYLIKTEPDVE